VPGTLLCDILPERWGRRTDRQARLRRLPRQGGMPGVRLGPPHRTWGLGRTFRAGAAADCSQPPVSPRNFDLTLQHPGQFGQGVADLASGAAGNAQAVIDVHNGSPAVPFATPRTMPRGRAPDDHWLPGTLDKWTCRHDPGGQVPIIWLKALDRQRGPTLEVPHAPPAVADALTVGQLTTAASQATTSATPMERMLENICPLNTKKPSVPSCSHCGPSISTRLGRPSSRSYGPRCALPPLRTGRALRRP
jgi:hypothetical protein